MHIVQIRISAIILSVLITLAFLFMLIFVGLVIYGYYLPESHSSFVANNYIFVCITAVIFLSCAFFAAAWISSYLSQSTERIFCIAHCLGSWASLALLLAFFGFTAFAGIEIQQKFSHLEIPYLLTDIEISKLRAITTIHMPAKHEHHKALQEVLEIKKLVIWVTCLSLFFGFIASLIAGLCVRVWK